MSLIRITGLSLGVNAHTHIQTHTGPIIVFNVTQLKT
jgi:hypothetical protein